MTLAHLSPTPRLQGEGREAAILFLLLPFRAGERGWEGEVTDLKYISRVGRP
jgi:hypothetical protein